MKNLRMLAVIAVILTVLPAAAQVGHRMMVNVPFAFSIGEAQFPAGRYTLETSFPQMAVALYDPQRIGQFVYTHSLIPPSVDTRGLGSRLVFLRVGGEYFLTEIWSGGQGRKLASGGMHQGMVGSVPDEKVSIVAEN